MTNENRAKIFNALMGKINPSTPGGKVVSEIVAEEIRELEPVIDWIVEQEANRLIGDRIRAEAERKRA